MPTREIARDEWQPFFDGFSRMHRGWLVTVEVLDEELGDLLEAREGPLSGVVAELRARPEAIEIMVGEVPERHITHVIREPLHVHLKESDVGAHQTLRVEGADGVVTLLTFRAEALPAEVDGVVSARQAY